MARIYEQFDAAFKKVTAYCVFDGATFVGRVAFKHGARTYCYAQVWGAAMVRGGAGGYGYDKTSAAAEAAFTALGDPEKNPDAAAHIARWKTALAGGTGERWNRRLEAAGYTVAHVID